MNQTALNYTEANSYEEVLMKNPHAIRTEEQCLEHLGVDAFPTDGIYCNGTWDTVLCWRAAKAGTTVRMHCPALPSLIKENFAYRQCGADGRWQGREPGDYSLPNGYTNYFECYTPEGRKMLEDFYLNKSPEQKQVLRNMINSARTMEIVGLSLSIVVTIISLIIFSYFRSLKCHRTRIHKNLFLALIVQMLIQLTQYIDQYVARMTGGEVAGAASGSSNAITDTPVFCEILYALLEYTKTVKFMWMFIEGLYLHNMIAVSVFSGKPNYAIFYAMGWGLPMLDTLVWVIVLTQTHPVRCWYHYYYLNTIWIIEAPRAAIISINLLFLLNIIRVLIMKLRESHTNDANQVRKAVKAAIVLLPLLGITNFVVMIEPSSKDIVIFGVWLFPAYFLVSFEGFFISLLYCFLNGEVRVALRRQWERIRQHRFIHSNSLRRMSRSLSIFTSVSEVSHASSSQVYTFRSNKHNQLVSTVQTNGHVQPLLRYPLTKRPSASASASIRRQIFWDDTIDDSSVCPTARSDLMSEQQI